MWSNVTVEEFIEVYSLGFDELTPTEYEIERLLMLTGEDYSDAYDEDLDDALKTHGWLKTFPRGKASIERLTKRRTLGQFIDLIHFRKVEHPYLHLDKIVARMCDGDFNDNLTYINSLPITDVIEHCDEIINWQDRIIKNYDSLFDTPDDDEDEPTEASENPFAWEQLIHKLCDGKIWLSSQVTSLPVIQCFNWLVMEQALKPKLKSQ